MGASQSAFAVCLRVCNNPDETAELPKLGGVSEKAEEEVSLSGSPKNSEAVTAEDEKAEREKIEKMKGKTRRAGVANESVSQDQMASFVKPVYEKPAEAKTKILNILKTNEKMQVLFGHLDEASRNDVVNAFYLMEPASGEDIIKQGDEGDRFYIIDQGDFDIYVARAGDDGKLGAPSKVATFKPGQIVGELALMYNAPRAATVRAASGTSKVWALDRDAFQMLIMSAQESKLVKYEGWLQGVDILKTLNHYELSTLSDLMQAELVEDGDVIMKQGDAGDKFYILEEGEVRAYISGDGGEKEVKTYGKPGDYFGEKALLTNQPRAATIKATQDSQIHWISKEDFDNVIGPVKDILMKNADQYPQYKEFLK